MKKLMLIALLLFPFSANADQAEIAAQVEMYLNKLTSLESDFVQKNESGEAASGKFYIKKPGKFRWEYLKGQPVLIVSDGRQLVYYDRELKEATYVGVKSTLAGFLARKEIKLSGEIKLLSAEEDENNISVELTQTGKPEEGKLGLIFSKKPQKQIQLTEMIVTDNAGQKTDIVFTNPTFGGQIDDKLFTFRDPKLGKNVWEQR